MISGEPRIELITNHCIVQEKKLIKSSRKLQVIQMNIKYSLHLLKKGKTKKRKI